jgi:hypothetical protein
VIITELPSKWLSDRFKNICPVRLSASFLEGNGGWGPGQLLFMYGGYVVIVHPLLEFKRGGHFSSTT